MVGAIDLLKEWKKICDSHTVRNVSNEIRTYSKCDNCNLKFLCVYKKPTHWNDEDILELVKKIKGD